MGPAPVAEGNPEAREEPRHLVQGQRRIPGEPRRHDAAVGKDHGHIMALAEVIEGIDRLVVHKPGGGVKGRLQGDAGTGAGNHIAVDFGQGGLHALHGRYAREAQKAPGPLGKQREEILVTAPAALAHGNHSLGDAAGVHLRDEVGERKGPRPGRGFGVKTGGPLFHILEIVKKFRAAIAGHRRPDPEINAHVDLLLAPFYQRASASLTKSLRANCCATIKNCGCPDQCRCPARPSHGESVRPARAGGGFPASTVGEKGSVLACNGGARAAFRRGGPWPPRGGCGRQPPR